MSPTAPRKKISFVSFGNSSHLFHIAPTAFALSERHPEYDCYFYIADGSRGVFETLAALYPKHRCHIVFIKPHWLKKWIYRLQGKVYFPRHTMRRSLKQLLPSSNAIVTPDFQATLMQEAKNVKLDIPFIFTFHGYGDRAYPFRKALSNYYLLLAGKKFRHRLANLGLLKSDGFAIVGYVKFDITRHRKPQSDYFCNNSPIVLYNPHFDEDESSLRLAPEVLAFFHQHTEYNLVFAPHINTNQALLRKIIKPQYRDCPNILIDTHSTRLIDMTYTQLADCYLGDMSSQLQEFLYKPRPCIFLNAHNVDWKNNPDYACWHLGDVITNLDNLKTHLDHLLQHNPYLEQQKTEFANTFDITEEPSADRAADAIAKFLSKS